MILKMYLSYPRTSSELLTIIMNQVKCFQLLCKLVTPFKNEVNELELSFVFRYFNICNCIPAATSSADLVCP